MEKERFINSVSYIIRELDKGNDNINPEDVSLSKDEFRELLDTMLMDKLIKGSDRYYDNALKLDTAYVTTAGLRFLRNHS